MNPVDLLVLASATFYAAYVVTSLDGPWHIFERFRTLLPLGGLTSCIWCMSFWMALALYGLMLTPLRPLVQVFAIAGIGLMLGTFSGAMR